MAAIFIVIQAIILFIYSLFQGIDGRMSDAELTRSNFIINSYAISSVILGLRLAYIGRFYKKFTTGRCALYFILTPAILMLASLIATVFRATIPGSFSLVVLYAGSLLGIVLALVVIIENFIHPVTKSEKKKSKKSAIITPDYAEDFPKHR